MSPRYKYSIIRQNLSFGHRLTMSKRLTEHSALMNFLSNAADNKQLKTVLGTLNTEQVNALGELAINVLYGTIPTTEAQRKLLKPFASMHEYIGDLSNSTKKRKELLIKKPQGITLVLKVAKPFLQLRR